MSQSPGPEWLPDPSGRHQYRWWDGYEWTENVSDAGEASVDPLAVGTTPEVVEPSAPAAPPAPTGAAKRSPAFTTNTAGGPPPPNAGARTRGASVPTTPDTPHKVNAQVAKAQGAHQTGQVGGGSIFNEPILVVNQKAKLIEIESEYAIYNQAGQQIGAIREIGQSTAKKVLRVISSMDQYMSKQIEVVDIAGNRQLLVRRPAKLIKSRFEVYGPTGGLVGSIVQRNSMGKIRFGFDVGGQEIGGIKAENWRAWNFRIEDQSGAEIARITKTWEGLAKTMFTTADNYVVHIHQNLPEPLRSLVIASALSIDTALKQDQRGWN